ncbi:MAG: alpha/beta hydrolase [Chitinispirillaceae bacterium]
MSKPPVVMTACMCMFVVGCLSLDPFLFKGEEISEYSYDGYTGKAECSDVLDSLGPIENDHIHEMEISSGDGKICGVLINETSALSQNDTAILYFHGTGPHNDYYWPRARLLHATGYPVLMIDYRGYGRSDGEPTEDGIYTDGYAALAFLRDSLGDPAVVVYAYSLGSLVGCEIAAGDQSGRILSLILEAPIGYVETMIKDASYIDLPGSYVTTYSGNNAEKIRAVDVPLLWMHGTEDETLALETNGRRVWNNYSGAEGYNLIVEGAGHRTIPSKIGYCEYCSILAAFIAGEGI